LNFNHHLQSNANTRRFDAEIIPKIAGLYSETGILAPGITAAW